MLQSTHIGWGRTSLLDLIVFLLLYFITGQLRQEELREASGLFAIMMGTRSWQQEGKQRSDTLMSSWSQLYWEFCFIFKIKNIDSKKLGRLSVIWFLVIGFNIICQHNH